MSLNSSNTISATSSAVPSGDAPKPAVEKKPFHIRALFVIAFTTWVFFGFMLAQALIRALLWVLYHGFSISFKSVNETLFSTVGGIVIYALAIAIVIGVPWLIKKHRTSLKDLGIQRFPSWLDMLLAPAGAVAYIILTTIISTLAAMLLTFVDYSQVQETGFSNLAMQSEYTLAFLSLVIVAPIAEELLFRGYLFGKLRKHAPLWVSILITSLLFAVVHFQWNVSIDVFALSIILCLLRVWSGSLWPSILLHMLKNGVAFYFLFINPSILSTLGG